MGRVGIFIIWLLHFLPLPLLNLCGQGLGLLFYVLGRERRHVGRTNLRLCFPQMAADERERLLRRHYRAFGRSVLERGILWWSSETRIRKLIRVEGFEHWEAVRGQPVLWLASHFIGLDMGGARLALEGQAIGVYGKQKDPYVDKVLLRGRTRFNSPVMLSRQDSMRSIIKLMRRNLPLYYFPDMDYGPKDSIFVPFFGVNTATITGVARFARLAGAWVLPVITRQLPGGQGYVLRFYPAWENFPTDDVVADTRRVNEFIEQRVLEMPEQYFWLHKRFKTRPPGEARPY